jgi:uncharacterized membrane protein
MSLPSKIQRIISEGYEFKFSDYISKGFTLVNKNIGGFIAFALVYVLITVAAQFIPLIGPIALWVIAPALVIGFAIVANKTDRDEPNTFSDFFGGFSKFGDLFLTALLTGLLAVLAALPGLAVFGYAMYNSITELAADPESLDGFSMDPSNPFAVYGQVFALMSSGMGLVGLLLTLIPVIYVTTSFLWAPYLVWFQNMKPWEAMQASRKLVAKNWWMTFFFVLVVALIGGLGLLLFCVGILYTFPVVSVSQYAAFADITELNEDGDDAAADVIDHFAPIQ